MRYDLAVPLGTGRRFTNTLCFWDVKAQRETSQNDGSTRCPCSRAGSAHLHDQMSNKKRARFSSQMPYETLYIGFRVVTRRIMNAESLTLLRPDSVVKVETRNQRSGF